MNFIAIDIETTGLYPVPNSKIYCVAVNTGKTIQVHTDIANLKPMLEDKSICKVIHNAAFDSFWLRMLYNIEVQNIWDTRIMEQVIIGENLPRSSKDQTLREELSSSLLYTLKRYGLAELENKSLGAAFATRDKNKPLTKEEIEYAKNDVKYLLHLQAMQERRLIGLDLMRVATLENKVVEVLVNMRVRGIGFDTKKWLDIAKQNELTYNSLMKRLPASVDNWNSPAQVKKYFGSRGIPIESLTGIEEVAATYNDPILNQFIEARALYKDVTTYGATWLEDDMKGTTVDGDGRIRTDFEQVLNTGRLSSSHPNLQNLRKDGLQRSAIVPRKGYVFVIGDFSQQELGSMAAASKEETWIKAMLRREDIHSLTASLLYTEIWRNGREKGCAFPKKCNCVAHKKVREHAKTINFAIAYGAGPQKLAASLKISEKDARKLLDKYKRVVPRLTRWLDTNSKNTIKTRTSYSADVYRRRRTLRDPEEWMLRNIGKNNPVQSAGANMTKLAMISLSKAAPLVLQIHDELVLEVLKKDAKKAAHELKSIMEKAADYCTGIPGLIEVEPRIADSLQKPTK
jgi:DNA polymerase I-like protein with 3'-5' exonuclease and polymerase domains